MQTKKDFLDELDLIELDNEILEIEQIQNKNLNNNSQSTELNSIIEEKEDWEKILENLEKKENKIYNFLFWFIRYIITSATIFAILLFTTNFSAYYQIIKSTLFKDEVAKEQQSILRSVNAAKLTQSIKQKQLIKRKEKELSKQKARLKKYSIRKITSIAYKETPSLDIDITPYENRIIIPKLGKNIPLLEVKNQNIKWPKELENIFMKELENWVIRYPGSAKPGKPGNTFIFWHSSNYPWIKWDYNQVFATLNNLKFGDKIIVYYNQKKYIYEITKKRVINPGDVSVLKTKQDKNELSLMTCWPVWTTLNRLVVSWVLTKISD